MVEVKGSVAALGALALLAVGAVLGGVLMPEPAYLPGEDQAQSSPVVVTVGSTEFDDPRTVSLTVTEPRTQPVLLQDSGMVTTNRCKSGSLVRSGEVAVSLDGRPLVLFATKRPLWRDLELGDRGSDVREVGDELARLEYLDEADRSDLVTRALALAMKELLADLGRPLRSGDPAIPANSLVWLPSVKATVLTCEIDPGQRVERGTLWATLAGVGAALSVADPPEDAAPGERTLVVGDQSVPLDENGQPDEAGAAAILSSAEVQTWQAAGSHGDLTGTQRLTAPIRAGVVPPAAVFGPSTETPCLIDEAGASVPIRILASQLGSTLVQPDSPGDELPQRVRIDVDGTGTCG